MRVELIATMFPGAQLGMRAPRLCCSRGNGVVTMVPTSQADGNRSTSRRSRGYGIKHQGRGAFFLLPGLVVCFGMTDVSERRHAR